MKSKFLAPLAAAILFAAAVPVALSQSQPASAVAAAPVYKSKSPKLTREQVDALLANPAKLLLIDVRRPDELTSIGGFPVYLSIQSKDVENSLAFIPKDRTIVTVSNHAARAGVAADLLTAKGFKVAGAVGVEDYEAQGGSLLKVAPVPPPAKAANAPATGLH
jgi:rhodanese-related sulfurtransferase